MLYITGNQKFGIGLREIFKNPKGLGAKIRVSPIPLGTKNRVFEFIVTWLGGAGSGQGVNTEHDICF